MNADRWRTLVLVLDDNRVLLGRKKRGFGAGKWNGFGGKVEPGESLRQAAQRELLEESGLTATALEQRGILYFTFVNGLAPLEVHVFLAPAWSGTPRETEEMAPAWFPVAAIPYGEMWADDPHWLPLVLTGDAVIGHFSFKDTEKLLAFEVKTVAAAEQSWHI